MIQTLLLGKNIKIIESSNRFLVGLEGKIIDESQNAFVIVCDGGEKTIIKNTCTFKIDNVEVEGAMLSGKPHERLKKKWKRKSENKDDQ